MMMVCGARWSVIFREEDKGKEISSKGKKREKKDISKADGSGKNTSTLGEALGRGFFFGRC